VNVTTLRGDGLLLHEGPAEVQGTVTVANGGVLGQQEALSGLHLLSANVSYNAGLESEGVACSCVFAYVSVTVHPCLIWGQRR
jgi:hypothetical protein